MPTEETRLKALAGRPRRLRPALALIWGSFAVLFTIEAAWLALEQNWADMQASPGS